MKFTEIQKKVKALVKEADDDYEAVRQALASIQNTSTTPTSIRHIAAAPQTIESAASTSASESDEAEPTEGTTDSSSNNDSDTDDVEEALEDATTDDFIDQFELLSEEANQEDGKNKKDKKTKVVKKDGKDNKGSDSVRRASKLFNIDPAEIPMPDRLRSTSQMSNPVHGKKILKGKKVGQVDSKKRNREDQDDSPTPRGSEKMGGLMEEPKKKVKKEKKPEKAKSTKKTKQVSKKVD